MNLRKIDFFQPKTKTYWCNGTGRDSYIYINNGGLTSQFSRQLINQRSTSLLRPARAEISPKQVHYYSNGSGRDQYIITDEGGFSKKYAPQKQMFATTLRSYERLPPLQSETNRDYFKDSQYTLPLIEKIKQRKIFQQQQFFVEKISIPKLNYQQLMQKSEEMYQQQMNYPPQKSEEMYNHPQPTQFGRSKNELHQIISNKMLEHKAFKTLPNQGQ